MIQLFKILLKMALNTINQIKSSFNIVPLEHISSPKKSNVSHEIRSLNLLHCKTNVLCIVFCRSLFVPVLLAILWIIVCTCFFDHVQCFVDHCLYLFFWPCVVFCRSLFVPVLWPCIVFCRALFVSVLLAICSVLQIIVCTCYFGHVQCFVDHCLYLFFLSCIVF